MASTEKQLILVAVKGSFAKPIFGPSIAKIIGAKKNEFKKSGNWRGWDLQIRTIQGYLFKPILEKKRELTYEEKVAKIKV